MSGNREEFGEYLAEVKSTNNKSIDFKLREKEIKHIRRCLRYYSNSYGRDVPDFKSLQSDDLSGGIYYKFLKFGNLKTPIQHERKKSIVKELKGKCSHEGCEEKERLTIAHIKPMASGVNNNHIGNLRLLCPKHHLLFDLKDILKKKGEQMERLNKRIEDIEQRGTTDTLGMGVLSKDKFQLLGDE